MKFEMIGVSMISPEGFAIRPRMPASCLICAAEPRAPELAIIQTGLIGSPFFGVRMAFIISSATFSVQFDQTSTTLLYFSPWVMRPSRYCCSYSFTFSCASWISFSFAGGMMRSSLPKEMPALQACWKPIVISRSQKMTVSFWPQWRYTWSMTFEISFLVRRRLRRSKPTAGLRGRMADSIMRPAVVATRLMTALPSLSMVSIRALILACSDSEPDSSACSISPISPKDMPSPFSPARSIVM